MSYLIKQNLPLGFGTPGTSQAYAYLESNSLPGQFLIPSTGIVEAFISNHYTLYTLDLSLSAGGESASALIPVTPPVDTYTVRVRYRASQGSPPSQSTDILLGEAQLVVTNSVDGTLTPTEVTAIAQSIAAELPPNTSASDIAQSVYNLLSTTTSQVQILYTPAGSGIYQVTSNDTGNTLAFTLVDLQGVPLDLTTITAARFVALQNMGDPESTGISVPVMLLGGLLTHTWLTGELPISLATQITYNWVRCIATTPSGIETYLVIYKGNLLTQMIVQPIS